ncbi:MAG: sulfide/dihydroorotate dehydrogenase-like FAD/NAD-binding protein [Lentisphaerae bacterium]|nr:sulfide/dihydroorotate dehydrogenase-like FAD/NAD-binding protein [Lentisphaerota bacterium]
MNPTDYAILSKRQLSENVFMMSINAPYIATERKPGQFILLSVDESYGERIPLTIADADPVAGSISIIFQKVGLTTTLLAGLEVGDRLAAVLGHLGQPTHITKVGTVVCVGGGIGVAPMRPIAKGFKDAGNRLICILGARNKDLLILEDEIRAFADEVIICTDDGSAGRKALVTAPLKELCERTPRPDLSVAIGPPVMMKFCAETVRPYGVPLIVSLNTIMVDGTGMCGGCRVTVGGETKFVCVDGPEFDGLKVDFDGMIKRLQAYRSQEQRMAAESGEHQCRMRAQAELLEKKK